MTFINLIKSFRNDEDGAVTVDWVVLTAAVVGLGIAVLSSVTTGTKGVTKNIEGYLSTIPVKEAF